MGTYCGKGVLTRPVLWLWQQPTNGAQLPRRAQWECSRHGLQLDVR